MNPPDTSYFANASQSLSNGLTPFAQNYTYGGNTIGSSLAQAQAWQGAALTNGAGPNASNIAAPFSFDQFAMGINPFINPGSGQPVQSGTVAIQPLLLLVAFIFFLMFLFRRV